VQTPSRPRNSRARRISGAVVAPALALSAVAAGTTVLAPAAVAAPAPGAGEWSTPVGLTGTADSVGVVDVRTAADGDAVAVTYRQAEGKLELRAAVRPANSGAWGPSTVLDSVDARVGHPPVQVLPEADGSVSVTWIRKDDSRSLLVARLSATTRQWSAPAELVRDSRLSGMHLAAGPSGRAAVVWNLFEGSSASFTTSVHASERDPATGTWSPGVKLDTTAPQVWDSGPRLLYAGDGSLTAVWEETSHPSDGASLVRTAGKPAGAAAWTAPETLAPWNSRTTYHEVATGPDGTAVLVWGEHSEIDAPGSGAVKVMVRRPGTAGWSAPEKVAAVDNAQLAVPLVGPDGEITLVWWDHLTAGGVHSATRSAAGSWSPVKQLSQGYVPEQFDAGIGPDGAVHAGWVEEAATGGRIFRYAARSGGAWSAPRTLSAKPSSVAIGQVAGGPDGRATAVWHESTGDFTGRLWASLGGPAPAVRRDHAGADGAADLFAQTAKGALTVYRGNGAGVLPVKVSGGTWPTTSTLIPFGDLDRDGVNDVLVRNKAGELWAYRPAKGGPVTPSSPAVRVGTGWSGFDAFTVSGDLTGDGRTDLVTRRAATGELFLYADNGRGGLAKGVRIGTGWKGLTLIGAGDLNGDRHADLLVRDGAGVLWRYYGNGKGAIGQRTRVGQGWNGLNQITGAGDLNRDGREDLLARDSSGVLWRYDGTGAGAFRKAVRIGGGWNAFGRLF
jgi:hypothetical protein